MVAARDTDKTAEIVAVNDGEHALELITRGEVDMQVATAKKYPRSIKRFMEDATSMVTLDEETAAACFYSIKRGDKPIEGPGVRLAEIVTSCWGNLRCEARVLADDGRFVTAQGTAWDMERNVLVRMETKRRITDRSGRTYSDDMVGVTGNAAASIAFRNAVFKVIPNAFTKQLYERARAVAVGDERTLADRRARAIEWFQKAGASAEQVLAMLGKASIEEVGLGELATLTGLKTAIQEGTTTLDQALPPQEAAALKPGNHGFGFKKASPPAAEQKPSDPKPADTEPAKAEPAATTKEQREKEFLAKKKAQSRQPGEDG